jgi:hypothetical protein
LKVRVEKRRRRTTSRRGSGRESMARAMEWSRSLVVALFGEGVVGVEAGGEGGERGVGRCRFGLQLRAGSEGVDGGVADGGEEIAGGIGRERCGEEAGEGVVDGVFGIGRGAGDGEGEHEEALLVMGVEVLERGDGR